MLHGDGVMISKIKAKELEIAQWARELGCLYDQWTAEERRGLIEKYMTPAPVDARGISSPPFIRVLDHGRIPSAQVILAAVQSHIDDEGGITVDALRDILIRCGTRL